MTFILFATLFATGPSHKKTEIPPRKVTASASSNVSLICLVEIDPDGCADSLELQWRHLRFNSSVLIQGDEKYQIQEKKTNTKCKMEFILTINNVTKDDSAKYRCQLVCRVGHGYVTSTTIELTVGGEEEGNLKGISVKPVTGPEHPRDAPEHPLTGYTLRNTLKIYQLRLDWTQCGD